MSANARTKQKTGNTRTRVIADKKEQVQCFFEFVNVSSTFELITSNRILEYITLYYNRTSDDVGSSSYIKLGPLFCLHKIPTSINCKCFTLDRSDIILSIHLSILFSVLLSYLIYLIIEYNDENLNSKTTYQESYDQKYTYPYIYFSWTHLLVPVIHCQFVISFNETVGGIFTAQNSIDISKNMTDSYIKSIESEYKVVLAANIYELNYDDDYVSALLKNSSDKFVIFYDLSIVNEGTMFVVPPIDMNWKNTLGIALQCNYNETVNTKDVYLTFNSGHRDDLLLSSSYHVSFANIIETLKDLKSTSGLLLKGGYMTFYEYTLSQIRDKINNNETYFYQYTKDIGYQISDIDGYNYIGCFLLSPTKNFIKKEWVIDQLFGWIDIVSKIGGLYSAITAILTPLFLCIVWGYKSKIIFVKSADNNAKPGYVETQKFKSLIEQYQLN